MALNYGRKHFGNSCRASIANDPHFFFISPLFLQQVYYLHLQFRLKVPLANVPPAIPVTVKPSCQRSVSGHPAAILFKGRQASVFMLAFGRCCFVPASLSAALTMTQTLSGINVNLVRYLRLPSLGQS